MAPREVVRREAKKDAIVNRMIIVPRPGHAKASVGWNLDC